MFERVAEQYRKLRALLQRKRLHRDFEQEVRAHLELRAQEYAERGAAPEEARRLAERRFGNRLALSEQAGDAWAMPRLEGVFQDLRYGARGLCRNPVFSLTAVAIIAAGIAATSSVFSVVDRLLFRSLPYPDSDRLVSVGIIHPLLDGEFLVSGDYFHLRAMETPFTALTSWRGAARCDLTEEHPQILSCAPVESTFLPAFGIAPVLGRNFTNGEDQANARKVALISYGLWQSRFGANPAAIGKTIPIDGVPTEIIGVLPRDFELPTLQRADLVVPQAVPFRTPSQGTPLRVFGRLKNGVTVEQARAGLGPFFHSAMAFINPRERAAARVALRSVRDFQIQDVKLASWVLFGATFAILLIVCANAANLLLARSAARQRELALRVALGAGRARLVRQTFLEALLLSAFGAAAGCALAALLLRVFKLVAPATIPRMEQAALDGRVLLFTVSTTLLCGILMGLAPAAVSPRPEVLTGWRASSCPRIGVRRFLTTAQIAVSLILLSGAGLLLETLWRMQNVAPGVNTGQVVTADITLGLERYPNSLRREKFFDDLLARLRANPLVASAALSDTVPPAGFVHNRPFFVLQVPGQPLLERGEGGVAAWRSISPDYFAALQIPILRGRGFREEERASREQTIVLSASLARRLFPNQDPIGRVIHFRPDGPDDTVIGVAADVDNSGIPGHPDPEYYLLRRSVTDPQAGANVSLAARALHVYDGEACLTVRSSARAGVVADWIRTEVAALDPTVPMTIATMRQRVRGMSDRLRFNAILLTLFALIGVLLAASGLYGLISFLVVQRTGEIGVRMALGATPARIARLVVDDALGWTAAGIAIGLAGAIVTARSLRSILVEVRAGNLVLFAAAALLLFGIALAAALLPSLRASRIDPIQALRRE
ncbi:MAG TPA: ABC transporter permease [Bryobacteraceae bacterium]|nr:ABC transporter permease [Bryobacteraceae bacterium]